ncbi:NAD(P)-dependent oxidoreductase [Propylenella binzhouense]|uniref:NAD(P)-dependent oxidoreductase n=1 Tax=Propylenella binzhouense TaxID=2555902 RepID=A0A964T453_9HYPH|nr:NAD(P)-dependent oxidoreductase [Propylenella binzhouense]MYZ47597.1 NAD(P)-dependent oxidoreductase [Propylenella binzhouense]
MERIIFIGLGAMGEPMAANLLAKGFDLTAVGNRRPEPVARLREQGAKVAADLAEAASGGGIAILMLPSSREVEAVALGDGGLLASLPAGSVVVDCSTSDPESTAALGRKFAARGVAMVDAPVTRGIAGAKQGKLAFFVGGDEADFARVEPALSAMGDTFHRMGALGSGHATKAMTNALSYATVALVGEMLSLGERLGIDLPVLQEALMSGAASKALESFGPRIIARDYAAPRVTIGNVCTHLAIAESMAARAHAQVPVLQAAEKVYRRVSALGHDASDMSSIAELWDGPDGAAEAGRAAS